MSEKIAVPDAFAGLVDLTSEALGAFALYATDDYFAEKENLLKAALPIWIEGRFTDKGKWMDGWESQRKREPGHDFCIIRLGLPGHVRGFVVDTTHFRGNAPQEVAIEGLSADHTATPAQLIASDAWRDLLPKSAVRPNFPNEFTIPESARVTHLRLRIYPDGGVARLRTWGVVSPGGRTFWQAGSIDLAAVENGGTVAAESDQFFGPATNLLLPGRGVNMGDGWETKRRRTPGSDWCVIKLGRRGVIDRIEVDTHFFKGNAPQATVIELLDEEAIGADELARRMRAPQGWTPLLSRTPLVQHRRHEFAPERPLVATHVRVQMFPHGGINRLRLFGHAVDTREEKRALSAFNALALDEADALALSFNGSTRWASMMLALRPFQSVRALFTAADAAWWSLDEPAFLEAFAAHPRIGDTQKAAVQTEKSGDWSKAEQSGTKGAEDATMERLRTLNALYWERFGFIFICFATGRTADEMLSLLEARVENDRATEIENAAREQAKITRLRIEKWLLSQFA